MTNFALFLLIVITVIGFSIGLSNAIDWACRSFLSEQRYQRIRKLYQSAVCLPTPIKRAAPLGGVGVDGLHDISARTSGDVITPTVTCRAVGYEFSEHVHG